MSIFQKLAIGARVMLTRNIYGTAHKGLMNGAQGKITGLVNAAGDKTVSFYLMHFRVSKVSIEIFQLLQVFVKFDHLTNEIPVKQFTTQYTSNSIKCSRKQIPLALSYCCTIHKCKLR